VPRCPQLLNGHHILTHAERYPVMASRLRMVQHLPVAGILSGVPLPPRLPPSLPPPSETPTLGGLIPAHP